MSTLSDSLDHPDMTEGTEPPVRPRRTLEPESASPAEIVANFQFTYNEQQCDLELLQWLFSDGSTVPRQGDRVTNLSATLKWPTLSQGQNHQRRVKDLRKDLTNECGPHASADKLEVSAFRAVLDLLEKEAFEMPPQEKQSRMKLTAQQVVGNARNVWRVEVNASEIMPVPTN